MNPKNTKKKKKSLCGCCPKPEEFNSDEVIFNYFGREFTEYEYIVENLAIRPAPKKLLDLVPVHNSDISKNTSICKESFVVRPREPMPSNQMTHNFKQPPTGEGDFQCLNAIKIRDANDDFISFKSPTENYQSNPGKSGKSYQSYCKPCEPRAIKEITELRQTIKSKDYRTPKQILSDLCEASEQSLNIRPRNSKDYNKPMSTEIKNTIERLRFEKPMPQFYTRTENKLFNTQGLYYAEVKDFAEVQDEEKFNKRLSIKENSYNQNGNQDPLTPIYEKQSQDSNSNRYSVNSTAQTEVSKTCPCPKKDKSLKWKIIINKHCKS